MAEIRIVCGRASTYTDNLGRVWAADNSSSSGQINTTITPIANTLNQPLFQSERYATLPALSYLISIPNGNYTCNLGFAEIFDGISSSGQRVFNGFIQNNQVLFNYDIFADTGGINRAIVKSFPIIVVDGIANIRLVSVVENAKISNIEIVPVVVNAKYFAAPLMLIAC